MEVPSVWFYLSAALVGSSTSVIEAFVRDWLQRREILRVLPLSHPLGGITILEVCSHIQRGRGKGKPAPKEAIVSRHLRALAAKNKISMFTDDRGRVRWSRSSTARFPRVALT